LYVLYYAPATASMVVHLALLEIGVPFRLERVDFDAGAQRDPAYLALNPQGVVPTLLIDGQPYTESVALLLLLADRHPQARLAPPSGSAARGRWYQWAVYLANPLASTFRLWFYPRDLGAPSHDPGVRDALRRSIEQAWDRLDRELAGGGPYLLGPEFSGVDLQLVMLMRWARRMPRPATDWPALRRLADRVRARPSWQRMYAAEGLTEW
jgi:glutathione S-transferase